jgi:hypothetical protein
MIRNHEEYQLQCALAAAAQLTAVQLTAAERTDLEQHTATCAACHAYMAEMAGISRELFLAQARRIKPTALPAGMQQRFLARAAAAGIPCNRPTPTWIDLQALRAAAIAILLAMSLSLTWRVVSGHGSEARTSAGTLTAQSQFDPSFQNAKPPAATVHPLQHLSLSHSRFRHGSAAWHRGILNASAQSIPEPHRSSFDLAQPIFARQSSLPSPANDQRFWSAKLAESPLAAGLLASARTSFPHANGATCFGIGEEGKPEERACHLEIKLASLSSLDAPHSPDLAPDFTPFRLSAPVLHLTPNPVP